MRVNDLPSAGLLSNGTRIRIEAAKAISAVQVNAGIAANVGKSSNAKPLKDFFDFASAQLTAMLDVVVPVIVARSITPSNTSRLTLTYGEGLDKTHVPTPAAFAITGQVRTVTKVTVDGPFVHLDVSAPFTAGAVNVAYTQPGAATDRLQDISNNFAASFTATAVTNSIV
jgi:hypothetical protein